MATGSPGTNGVWQYGEDDSETTFSALLNKAASTTDTQIGLDRGRLTTLEARPLSGLVPVSPISIVIASGSGSANTLGEVTYTGATSVSFNNVFTSAYKNYKITMQQTVSTNTGFVFRFRSGGVDNGSAVYNDHFAYWGTGGSSSNVLNNGSAFGGIFGHANQRGTFEVLTPQLARRTGITFFGVAEATTGGSEQHVSSCIHKSDTQFDGFSIYPLSGTASGTIQVFGYND